MDKELINFEIEIIDGQKRRLREFGDKLISLRIIVCATNIINYAFHDKNKTAKQLSKKSKDILKEKGENKEDWKIFNTLLKQLKAEIKQEELKDEHN